jgi:hypothetical protein
MESIIQRHGYPPSSLPALIDFDSDVIDRPLPLHLMQQAKGINLFCLVLLIFTNLTLISIRSNKDLYDSIFFVISFLLCTFMDLGVGKY